MAQLDFYRQQIQARNANNPNIGGISRVGAYTERMSDIVAKSAMVVSERAERRMEEDAAIDAASKLAATQRQWMVRERELREEAMSSGNIDGYPQRIMEEYEPYVQEQLQTVKTPRARAYLEERLASYGTQLFGAGMQFEADARTARSVEQADAALEDLRVVLDQDPDQYGSARETLGTIYAQIPPGPERERAWRDASSRLSYQAALARARKDPEGVMAALDSGGLQYVDDLDADNRVRLRSFAEAEMTSREVRARQAESEARDATINGMFDALEANGGDLLSLVQADPDAFNALDPEDQIRVNNYAGGIATGANRPTDWVQYQEFIENPALLKSVNLGAIREQFNPKQFGELQDLQTAMMEDPQIEQQVQTTNTIIGGMLENAGYSRKKGDPATADADIDTDRGKFYSLLRDAVDQEVAVKGRKLTQRETVEIAEGLLVDVVVGKRLFGYGSDKKEDLFMAEIPNADMVVVKEYMQQNGIQDTPYNTLMVYKSMMRDRGLVVDE